MNKGTERIIGSIALFVGVLLLAWTLSGCRAPGPVALVAPPASAGVPGAAIPELPLFSPNGGCETAIVTQIRSARKSVDVLAYTFTNDAIARAVLAKATAGVAVRVVLDSREAKSGGVAMSLVAPVQVRRDGRHATMHDKVIIIDGVRGLTGSYNLTNAAETMNAENVIGFGAKVAAEYEKEFEKHWNHAAG